MTCYSFSYHILCCIPPTKYGFRVCNIHEMIIGSKSLKNTKQNLKSMKCKNNQTIIKHAKSNFFATQAETYLENQSLICNYSICYVQCFTFFLPFSFLIAKPLILYVSVAIAKAQIFYVKFTKLIYIQVGEVLMGFNQFSQVHV